MIFKKTDKDPTALLIKIDARLARLERLAAKFPTNLSADIQAVNINLALLAERISRSLGTANNVAQPQQDPKKSQKYLDFLMSAKGEQEIKVRTDLLVQQGKSLETAKFYAIKQISDRWFGGNNNDTNR